MAPLSTSVSVAAPPPPPSQTTETFVPEFHIRSYQASDYKTVCELFAEGMLFYAPPVEKDPKLNDIFHKYVERCFTADLGSIEATYMGSGGHFWVVTAKTNDGTEEIAAMVGLEGKGNRKGELRRLAVTAKYRRHRLAFTLVSHLEQWAKNQGFHSIQLNTDCIMAPALSLYARLGYQRTHYETTRPNYYLVWFVKYL